MNNIPKIIETLQLYQKNLREPTIRRTSKTHKDPFKTLITCLLSLRTQDKNTEKASSNLFKIADTPQEISKLPLKKLEKLIYSSGYYKNKAKTIKHVSKVILEKYQGKVPNDKEELLSIKGIGPKTANIVLNFAFNKDVLPIDTHCHRIPNRIGWVSTKTPEQTEKELEKIIPKKYWKEFNTIFVLFGKTVCVSISPFCSRCPIENSCKKINVKRKR